MTLTIHSEEDDQRQLAVTIEVAEERVQKAMRAAARKLARDVEFPGFRKGKVPYPVLVRRVGEEALRAEAVEELINEILPEVMEKLDVEMYATPNLNHLDLTPLRLELTLPLRPIINLGDYRSSRKEIAPIEITEAAIEEAVEHLRTHHEEREPVDRPSQPGDVLVVTGSGKVIQEDGQGEVIFDQERMEFLLDPEKTFAGTPFVQNLVDLSAGDEKEFTVTFPADYSDQDLAGHEARFKVTAQAVFSRTLPAVDDELAKRAGKHQTLAELRQQLAEEQKKEAEETARSERLDEMVSSWLESAEIRYPPAALENELDEIIESLKRQMTRSGWKWEDYLTVQGHTEEELRENWRERAEARLRRSLVLQQFISQERLRVKPEEEDEAIESRLATYDDETVRNFMRDRISKGSGRELLLSSLLLDKTMDRVDAILSGTAPDLGALAAEAGVSAEEEE